MADAGEIKSRISSVEETQKVTAAMYMISSVKMRRAKREVQNTEPYLKALEEEIAELVTHIPDTNNRYLRTPPHPDRPHARHGILLVTSDKGLAGSYNHTAIKVTEEYRSRHPETRLFVIGAYGWHYFHNKKIPFEKDFVCSAQFPTIWEAEKICMELLELYDREHLDEIDLIYTDYLGGRPNECRRVCLLPLNKSKFEHKEEETEDSFREFYPDADTVLSGIIPSYLTGFVYSALVDSYCSEQEARMTAMNTAGKNAEEMLKQLKIQYNRIRQAAITREMIEITSGAKALRRKGKKGQKMADTKP